MFTVHKLRWWYINFLIGFYFELKSPPEILTQCDPAASNTLEYLGVADSSQEWWQGPSLVAVARSDRCA